MQKDAKMWSMTNSLGMDLMAKARGEDMTVLGMELFIGQLNIRQMPRYGAEMTVLGMVLFGRMMSDT